MKPKSIDKRNPPASSPQVTNVMRANKSKDTVLELTLRRALRDVGLNGYRLHMKGLPGCPDIAFPKWRVAIFVNGCFWHRCSKCDLPLPKSNTSFWEDKFKRNVDRDKKKTEQLEKAGWYVITCWEHDIGRDPAICAKTINNALILAGM
jgi:DNA mismatch endonuclease (patch repair protein)